jgi:hypothetical protein
MDDYFCYFNRLENLNTYTSVPAVRWLSGNHECGWAGVTCDEYNHTWGLQLGRFRTLVKWRGTTIADPSLGLTYSLADVLSILSLSTFAFNLGVSGGQNLTGPMPSEVFFFPFLQAVQLTLNQLSGTLPEISPSRVLSSIEVDFNQVCVCVCMFMFECECI